MGIWIRTFAYLIGSAILTRWIPFSSLFRNIDTMVHEFGHAALTLALSGRVSSIQLFANHSGVTHSVVASGWPVLVVGLAGYMTASLIAWALFALYARDRQQEGLLLITLMGALSMLFVRGGFGYTWLAGFIALTLAVTFFGGRTVRKFYYLFVAFLSLEESVLGPLTLLALSVTDASGAGDASLLATATSIPPAVWSVWFLLFALWCAMRAVRSFTYRSRGKGHGGARGIARARQVAP